MFVRSAVSQVTRSEITLDEDIKRNWRVETLGQYCNSIGPNHLNIIELSSKQNMIITSDCSVNKQTSYFTY